MVRLRGSLDVDALRASLASIVARHEVLRSVITTIDGEPVVRVLDDPDPPLRFVDLTDFPGDRDAEAMRLLDDEVRRPFDLASDVLLRGLLVRVTSEDHLLAIVAHHIASDEPSKRLVAAELKELYASHTTGAPSQLPPLPLQYSDYARWQRDRGVVDIDREIAYWLTQLRGAPAVLDLPTDRPVPPVETHKGATVRTVLSPSLSDQVRALGRAHQATLFMTLTAAFATTIEHWCGQDDFVIGTPITGRTHDELQPLIGFFSNTLALRIFASGNPTFAEMLAQVRETCAEAYAHQSVPFERLVEELRPPRDLSRNPIFQVMFTLRPGGVSLLELDGLTTESVGFEGGWSKFFLNVIAIDRPSGITLIWEYNSDLFDRSTIERLGRRYEQVFEAVCAQPERPIADLEFLPPEELESLRAWNATSGDTTDACLHTLIGERARATPDAVAVRSDGRELTYGELWDMSLRLARLLRGQGVGPGVRVGLWAERCAETIAGIVGILAAGGAYVPLEPTYPADRLAFTVADAGIDLVVVPDESAATAAAAAVDRKVIAVHEVGTADEDDLATIDLPAAAVTPTDLAYVIYTSGSTGRPKGVMIEHRSVVNLLEAMAADPGLSAGETMIGLTTLAFDLSVPDVFLPLVVGATLVLVGRETATDPAQLAARFEREGADLVQATPATWTMLCQSGWKGRRGLRLVCGGERYSARLVRDLIDRGAGVWNFYGPTEATVWAVSQALTERDGDPLPMGKPVKNVRCHVVDRLGRLVPIGAAGELLVSGAGVARGYLNRPELTAERFVPEPGALGPGDRAYRTGDIVRRRADGQLVFLRRNDDQVKLRGYRIELGEIEATLGEHPAVADAAATLREDSPGSPSLCAYVVPVPDMSPPSTEELRALVARKLPAYMVPSWILTVDALPLTPNGKVDRARLPRPSTLDHREDGTEVFVAPRTPTEKVLAGIWADVLGLDRVSVTADFFNLGGHSMLAVRMVARVESAFDRKLPLAVVMQAGTIEQLAGVLAEDRGAELFRSVVEIKPGASPIPLFCVHGMSGTVTGYRHLVPHLEDDQRVFGIQAPGLDGEQLPFRSVEELASHYVDEIRAIQPRGPYLLTGVCFGGLVVFEMAHQLTTRYGETVSLLALIDPPVMRTGFQQVRRRIAKLRYVERARRAAFVRETLSIFLALANRKAWDVFIQIQGRHKPLPRRSHAMEALNRRVAKAYEPVMYPGPVLLIRSDGLKAREGERHGLAWDTLGGPNVEVLDVPAIDHKSLFRLPHVREVGLHLQASIDRAVREAAATGDGIGAGGEAVHRPVSRDR